MAAPHIPLGRILCHPRGERAGWLAPTGFTRQALDNVGGIPTGINVAIAEVRLGAQGLACVVDPEAVLCPLHTRLDPKFGINLILLTRNYVAGLSAKSLTN